MKKTIYISLVLSALTACSDLDYINDIGSELVMTFSGEYPMLSRTNNNGFTDGDEMGIFVADYKDDIPMSLNSSLLKANNMRFTYDEGNNQWNGTSNIYWDNSFTPVDVIGYFPYTKDIENPLSYAFSVKVKQTQEANYEQSDLLWAKIEKQYSSNQKLMLQYRHKMSSLVINLQRGQGFTNDEWANSAKNVIVNNTNISCIVNLETGVITNPNNIATIYPMQYGESYRCVIPPQKYASGVKFFTIDVNGNTYSYSCNEDTEFASGMQYTFQIEVNKASDSGDYIFKCVDESICPWQDDADFHEGIIRQYITINVASTGKFAQTLKENGHDYTQVTALKVTGYLNYDDLCFIGDMPMLTSLNLKEVVIDNTKPEEDDYIGSFAFENSPLIHIVFPDRLIAIGRSAFEGCNLKGTVIFPDGLEIIEKGAFRSWSDSEGTQKFNAIFPNSLKVIEDGAFYRVFSGTLNLPEGLQSIGSSCFARCFIDGSIVLPESLETIGESAFSCPINNNANMADLIIPKNIKVIPDDAFSGCKFQGNLILPEGLLEIGANAFNGCQFKGALQLPSSLKIIGENAFTDNYFSSIEFPENLSVIGPGAFKDCKYLSGHISIPEGVIVIPDECFYRCPLITSVTLHKNIVAIKSQAFYDCQHLKSITVEACEPPELSLRAFDGDAVHKEEIVVEVPKESLYNYQISSGWREFSRLTEYSNFLCRPTFVSSLGSSHSETIILNADGDWCVEHKPDWIKLSQYEGSSKASIRLTFEAANSSVTSRTDSIVFKLKNGDARTYCQLSQYNYKYGEDEIVQLQSHSRGKGISIFMVGDGWDAQSISNNDYLNLCCNDMEYFFGLPPYDRLRDFFDVYCIMALSQETGISTINLRKNTRLGTMYSPGCKSCCSGTSDKLLANEEAVFSYISALTGKQPGKRFHEGDFWNTLIILIPNSVEYEGSCQINFDPINIAYEPGDGSAIAICPPSVNLYPYDTRGTIQKIAGGMGFGCLADESIKVNKFLTEKLYNEIINWQLYGYFNNISVYGNPYSTPWSELIFKPEYSNKVDIYEGAYGYARNVYRSENNSCMNNQIPYYNAISRLNITRRVYELAKEEFDIKRDFYDVDSFEWGNIPN